MDFLMPPRRLIKTEYPNGKVEVVLIASKTRVAPISKQTIPRLELLGALILARLVKTMLRAFKSIKVDDVFLWTDSLTTLCWIKNNENWKQYTHNRVNEIRELTNTEQWRHCPGHLNPADLPSRGCNGMDLVRHESWSSGPDFLQQPKEQWPVEHQTTQDDDKLAFTELVKHPPPVSYSLTTHSDMARKSVHLEKIIDLTRFSTKKRVVRVTATVLRFIKKSRKVLLRYFNISLFGRSFLIIVRYILACQCAPD